MGRASQEGLLSSPTVVATPAAVLCPPHMGLASLWASGCPPPFLIASSTAEALPSPVCPPPLGRQPQGGHWEGRGLGRSRDLWDSCTPLLGMSSTNTAHAFQRKALLSCGLHLDNVSPAPRRVLLALLPGPFGMGVTTGATVPENGLGALCPHSKVACGFRWALPPAKPPVPTQGHNKRPSGPGALPIGHRLGQRRVRSWAWLTFQAWVAPAPPPPVGSCSRAGPRGPRTL